MGVNWTRGEADPAGAGSVSAGQRPSSTMRHRRSRTPPVPARAGIFPRRIHLCAGQPLVDALKTAQRMIPADLEAAARAGDIVDSRGRPLRLDEPAPGIAYVHSAAPDEPGYTDPLEIVWSSPRARIVNKPAGIATIPRGSHIACTVTTAARRQWGNDSATPAHRLDRLTSGLLLIVTDPTFRGAYQTLFDRRAVEKTYRAVTGCRGPLPRPGMSRELRVRLARARGEAKVRPCPDGKLALTEAKVTAVDEDRRLLEWSLRPRTGLTHQLRVSLAVAGFPILGDPLYGSLDPRPACLDGTLHLHAASLSLKDPVDGRDITCHAPPPWGGLDRVTIPAV